jgi:hypothetical protein
VVRFDNDEGNIPFETDEEDMVKNNRRVRKRAIGDEKFVWYAGKVKKVSSRGGVIVKLFDKDVVTLTPKEAALEMKRTTKDRLKSLLGKKKYALPITNTDALKLSKGPLVVRTLDKVLDVDSESFEGDLALPVNKMTVDPKALGEAYANHEWLGGWINFHGNLLNERFSLKAYKLVNHLLMNISGKENELENINAEIHLVSVDSDLFYPAFEIKNTYHFLQNKNKNVQYHEINSIHGHDAFLMEYEQLNTILKPIFLN